MSFGFVSAFIIASFSFYNKGKHFEEIKEKYK